MGLNHTNADKVCETCGQAVKIGLPIGYFQPAAETAEISSKIAVEQEAERKAEEAIETDRMIKKMRPRVAEKISRAKMAGNSFATATFSTSWVSEREGLAAHPIAEELRAVGYNVETASQNPGCLNAYVLMTIRWYK